MISDAPIPSASSDPTPLSGAPSELLIVAGAITDSFELPRLLLAARRTAPEWAHGMWEFAGGKVEPRETVVEGLHRELAEELGVDIVVGDELRGPDVSAVTDDAVWEIRAAGLVPAPGVEPSPLRFVMRLFWCELAPGSGQPEPLEDHDQLRWLEPGSWLDGVPWLPADERIVAALLNDAVARHRRHSC